jgi:hypothetical protein
VSVVTDIRQAIADSLTGIDGLQALRNPIANPTPPTAWVTRAKTEWDITNARGTDLLTFNVEVFVGLASDVASQDLIDQFADPYGPRSIKQAVEAGDALDELVGLENVQVTEAGPDHTAALPSAMNATKYLAVVFSVEIYAPGR